MSQRALQVPQSVWQQMARVHRESHTTQGQPMSPCCTRYCEGDVCWSSSRVQLEQRIVSLCERVGERGGAKYAGMLENCLGDSTT